MKLTFFKHNWWFLGSICLILFIGYILTWNMQKSSPKTTIQEKYHQVDYTKIQRRSITQQIYCRGSIQSIRHVSLQFEISGKIAKIGLDEEGNLLTPGKAVQGPHNEEPGQLLAALDDREQVSLLEQAEAELYRAKGELKESENAIRRAQSELNYTQITFQRLQQLHQNHINSKRTIDEAKHNLNIALANLDEATEHKNTLNNEVRIYTQKVSQARLNLERCVLRAPFSGTIADFKVQLGAYIQPEEIGVTAEAKPVHSTQITLIDPSAYEVTTKLPLHKAEQIRTGAKATIKLISRHQPVKFDGYVTSISPILSTKTKMVQVRIHCTPKGATIFDGENVAIAIDTKHLDTASVIPRNSLLYENGLPYCFVIADSGKIQKIFPTLGIADDNWVQVISGIAVDARIATKGKERLRNGISVMINNESTL